MTDCTSRISHTRWLRPWPLPLLFALLFGLFGLNGNAQTTVTVGTGTGTNTGFPITSCYDYSYTQQLYLGTEILAGGGSPGLITNIRFFYATAPGVTATSNGWTVYMSNTGVSALSTGAFEPIGGFTQVFSGTVTFPAVGNWMDIALTTPFNWTGGNLLVAVDENVVGWSCSAAWRVTTTAATRAIRYYADGTNPNPASPPVPNGNLAGYPNAQFVIAPSSACTGTPAPGNTTGPASVCSGAPFSLGLQNITLGSGVTYQWQSSPDGVTWSNVGTSSPSYSTTQSTNTWYQAIVTCSEAGGGSTTSTPLQVTMNSFLTCYCSSAATNAFDEEILNVSFGSLNNSSACDQIGPGPGSVASLYNNYTTLTPVQMMQLQSVPLSISIGQCNGGNWTNAVAVFIDYNQNGILTDPGEMVYSNAPTAGAYTTSGSVSIPLTATPGITLMRVVNVETSSAITPCGTYFYGETEDYLIEILEAQPCTGTPDPGNTTGPATACSGATIQLGLENETLGTGVTIQWQVSTDGSGGPWTNVGTNSATYSTSQTVESWYQAVVTCDGAGSGTSTPLQVSMSDAYACLCSSSSTSTADSEMLGVSFGTMSNTSDCVTPAPGPGSVLGMYSNFQTSVPAPQVFTGQQVPLSVNAGSCGGFYPNRVAVFIDWNHNGTFELIERVLHSDALTTPFTQNATVPVPLDAELGLTAMRVIQIESSSEILSACGTYTWGETEDYLIEVVPPLPCSSPTDLVVFNTSSAGFSVSWTDAVAASYNWEVRTSGLPGSGGELESGNTTDDSFTTSISLSPNTTYYIYVQADCGVDGLSYWAGPVTMYTGYCAAGSDNTNPGNIATVNNVLFANIDQNTTGNAGYVDHTSTVGNVNVGTTYTMTLSRLNSYTFDQFLVWIDWNDDFDFSDAGELVHTSPIGVDNPYSAEITVPGNATPGTKRMRIRRHYNDEAGGWVINETPCGNAGFGQVLDFTLFVCAPITASATVVDDCANQQFSVAVDVTEPGTYTILYTVDGGSVQSTAYTGSTTLIGPFAGTSEVVVSLDATQGCIYDLGSRFSGCPIMIDCDATSALAMSHCYDNGDTRTFTFVSSDPGNTLVFKFLNPSPVLTGDGVTFYNGTPDTGTQITLPPAGGDLSSLGYIASSGNTMSFTIQTDGTGSCADNTAPGDWDFLVRCAGCIEPSADPFVTTDCNNYTFNVEIDLWDLGFSDITGLPTNSADIQYTVNGGPATVLENVGVEVHDLGTFNYGDVVNVVILHEDDGACNLVLGNILANVTCPPFNDQCANAQAVNIVAPGTCGTGAVAGTTTAADMSGVAPSCATGPNITDVWYSFNSADFISPISFSIGPITSQGMGMEFFTACDLAPLGCVPGNGAVLNNPAPNTEYLLRVYSDITAGNFTLCITGTSASALCASAINIPSAPVTNQALACGSGNLLSATSVPTACGAASNSYKGGVEAIYTFTPSESGPYQISYTGQTWSSIFVYSGACPSSGGTCVNSIGTSASSKNLIVYMDAGTTYYIWFDTWPTPNSPCPGTFSLTLLDCVAPMGVTVNAVGTSAFVNWSGGPATYVIEYGPSASFFTPGTGATAGTGGTVVTTSTWPYEITGLTAGTEYRFFVREFCDPNYSSNSTGVLRRMGPAINCNTPFFDNGGSTSAYLANENWVVTVCPDAGEVAQVVFNSFITEANWDRLYIYNGPSTSSPLFSSGNGVGFGTSPYGAGGWWGDLTAGLPGPFTSTDPSGCITFAFWSDGGGQFAGWDAQINCLVPVIPGCLADPISPADGESACEGATILSWPMESDASSYDVYFDAGAGPATTLVSSAQIGLSYNAGVLAPGTYSWRVEPRSAVGVAVGCEDWTFVRIEIPVVTASNDGPVCPDDVFQLNASTVTGATYNWSGPGGFNSVDQNTSHSQATDGDYTYTLIATVDGCPSAPSSTIVTVNPNPVISSVSADPMSICSGSTTQLEVNAIVAGYTVAPITYAPVSPAGTPSSGPSGDDAVSGAVPIGFPFLFNGASYTDIYISTNGFISFNNEFNAGCCTGQFMPDGNTPNAVVALAWEDLNPNSGGTIDYFNLTSPNRMVVRFNSVHFYGSGGAQVVNGQIILYEDGAIEIHNTDIGSDGFSLTTQGVENGDGTEAWPVPGRNSAVWSATNDAYRFSPNAPSYLWDNAADLDDATVANPVASPTGTTLYTVTVTSAGCTTTGSVEVTVGEPLNVEIIAGDTICAGEETVLSAIVTGGGEPYTYIWSPGGATDAEIFVTPSETTVYELIVNDGCGNADTVNQTIVVEPTPTASASASSACSGGDLQLTGVTDALDYSWSGPNGYNSTELEPVIIGLDASDSGIYTFTATLGQCSATAEVNVVVSDPPVIASTTAESDTICTGGSAQLNVELETYDITINMSNPNGLQDEISWSFTNSLNQVLASGAAFSLPSNTVIPSPTNGPFTLNISTVGSWNDNQVGYEILCGPNQLIAGTVFGGQNFSQGGLACGSGDVTYSWSPAASLDDPTIADPVASPTETTVYTVTVSSTSGCSASSAVSVVVVPGITPTVAASYDSPACSGSDVQLTGTTDVGVSFLWTGPNAFNSTDQNPVISGADESDSGVYTFTATNGSCSASDEVTVVITQSPSLVSVTAEPAIICAGETSQLLADAGEGVSPYCTPTFSSGCGIDYISNVTIAGINRSSTCDGAYTLFNTPTGNLIAGSTGNSYSVSTGGDTEGAAAWIDYNQNGVFEASENIFNGYLGSNPATYAGTFNVPVGARNGTTRMRVLARYAQNPGTGGACTAATWGEAEDYLLDISGGSDGFTYLWNNAASLNDANIADPIASPTETTTYVVTVTNNGCVSTDSVTVTVNTADTDGDGVIDCEDSCPAFPGEVGDICDPGPGMMNGVITSDCACVGEPIYVEVTSRVFLDGPYNTTTLLMGDNLRNQGLIPTAHPYAGAPFNHTGTETVDPAVLAVTGNDAIVDWVMLELRADGAPSTVIARRAALVQRDGNIVDTDGVGPVKFFGVEDGNYHLAVRHRNHLGVMTAGTYALSQIPTDIDLTIAGTATYGTNARRDRSGVMTMWGGNANGNSNVRYAGLANDRLVISNAIGASTPTATLSNVYHNSDLNMNGNVRYAGLANDRLYLSNVIGASTPTATVTQQLP